MKDYKYYHMGQQVKHIKGHNNFEEGRSYFNHGVDPAELLDGVHSGKCPVAGAGSRGNPIVDFGGPIGGDGRTGQSVTRGQIHYGKNGAHIVPDVRIKMMFTAKLPDWLIACFRIALLGEIYPNIRAIAVGYHEDGLVLIRYYLDRQPIDYDFESIEVVATNLDALGGGKQVINKIDVQCVYADGYKRELEALSGFIYSRREYS